MAKAPDNIIFGSRWSYMHRDKDVLDLEEGQSINIQFGKGERNRSIMYLVKEIRKTDDGKIHYVLLERKPSRW